MKISVGDTWVNNGITYRIVTIQYNGYIEINEQWLAVLEMEVTNIKD